MSSVDLTHCLNESIESEFLLSWPSRKTTILSHHFTSLRHIAASPFGLIIRRRDGFTIMASRLKPHHRSCAERSGSTLCVCGADSIKPSSCRIRSTLWLSSKVGEDAACQLYHGISQQVTQRAKPALRYTCDIYLSVDCSSILSSSTLSFATLRNLLYLFINLIHVLPKQQPSQWVSSTSSKRTSSIKTINNQTIANTVLSNKADINNSTNSTNKADLVASAPTIFQ
jgi:hypothetical protein